MPPSPPAETVATRLQSPEPAVFAGSVWRSRTLRTALAALLLALLVWVLLIVLGFDPSPVGKALHVIADSGAHAKP